MNKRMIKRQDIYRASFIYYHHVETDEYLIFKDRYSYNYVDGKFSATHFQKIKELYSKDHQSTFWALKLSFEEFNKNLFIMQNRINNIDEYMKNQTLLKKSKHYLDGKDVIELGP